MRAISSVCALILVVCNVAGADDAHRTLMTCTTPGTPRGSAPLLRVDTLVAKRGETLQGYPHVIRIAIPGHSIDREGKLTIRGQDMNIYVEEIPGFGGGAGTPLAAGATASGTLATREGMSTDLTFETTMTFTEYRFRNIGFRGLGLKLRTPYELLCVGTPLLRSRRY